MPDDSPPGGAPANEEFIADPTGHLLAIIDDADAAVAAERDLDGSGIEGVRIFRGSRSADAIRRCRTVSLRSSIVMARVG
ncbi:MAG TPA: hypothetical protein PLX85_01980 [Dehalococcoidia bacterium]|nr:hypothetical protein [Dehalococcoidia bacterium]